MIFRNLLDKLGFVSAFNQTNDMNAQRALFNKTEK